MSGSAVAARSCETSIAATGSSVEDCAEEPAKRPRSRRCMEEKSGDVLETFASTRPAPRTSGEARGGGGREGSGRRGGAT
eukprot:3782091-Prymnesium_polylepis.1